MKNELNHACTLVHMSQFQLKLVDKLPNHHLHVQSRDAKHIQCNKKARCHAWFPENKIKRPSSRTTQHTGTRTAEVVHIL